MAPESTYFWNMRGILGPIGFSLCLSTIAQWTPITFTLPNWYTYGNTSTNGWLFTGPGIGFAAQSTYVSPSIGIKVRFVATDDEWATNSVSSSVDINTGGRAVSALWRSSDRSLFYQRLISGTIVLGSISRHEGVFENKIYPVAGGTYDTLLVCPTGETSAYALTHRETGELVLRRVQPNTFVVVTGIPDSAQKVNGLHFYDEQTGAIRLRSMEGLEEVWITTDGGQQWSLAWSDSQTWIRAMKWFDDQVAWLLGDEAGSW
jgi:hypothetical protein